MSGRNGLQFDLILMERGTPLAFWHAVPTRGEGTLVSLHMEDNTNVLAVCDIITGIAVELLPDEIKPKGMALREILSAYIKGDNEKDIPF